MRTLLLKISLLVIGIAVCFSLGVMVGCNTGQVKVPEDSTEACTAYYSTLIIIGQSDKGFITSGKKDFGLAGTWMLPCHESIKTKQNIELEKAKASTLKEKIEAIEKCKRIYFKDKIVSKEDAEIYLKYIDCIKEE